MNVLVFLFYLVFCLSFVVVIMMFSCVNILCASSHSKDGTQGKLDSTKAQEFFNMGSRPLQQYTH
jgi:hypothetical protein